MGCFRGRLALLALSLVAIDPGRVEAAASEDIEFVAEHLPEVAMSNRVATLPVWSSLRNPGDTAAARRLTPGMVIGYSRTRTGELSLAGATFALSLQRSLGERWSATAFGFHDRESFAGRGILTHLAGPGFDLRGDTDAAGNGKHFGDASLALGVAATYEPWGLTVDLGSTLAQATLERVVHLDIDSNGSLAIAWRF